MHRSRFMRRRGLFQEERSLTQENPRANQLGWGSRSRKTKGEQAGIPNYFEPAEQTILWLSIRSLQLISRLHPEAFNGNADFTPSVRSRF